MKKHAAGLVASLVGGLAASAPAAAIELKSGEWALNVNGTVNAFYVNSTAETTLGGVTTETKQANVQNGLLPGWINFVVTTQQQGYDIKAHFGYAPGINSNSSIVGLPDGVDSSPYAQTDHRNVYFQFGNASMGTLKFGRDIGLFAQTPILNDMTLLGVGGTTRAAEPFNTSFGMIGHGYMYTGFQPQITYSLPAMGGFNAAIGIFNPSQYAGTERKSPGIQGLASYDWKGDVSGKAWFSFVNQKTEGVGGHKASGYEGGVKVGLGRFEVLASGFTAEGLGISTIGAQFLGGFQNGKELESDGVFLQGTVKATDQLKLGVSYGKNTDKDLIALGSESTNKAAAFGAYYSLTPAITLVGEYIAEKQENPFGTAVGDSSKQRSVSLGAILFF